MDLLSFGRYINVEGYRIAKRIWMFAKGCWPRGRRCSGFSDSLAIIMFAVNGRLRCANRPYIMGLIVTSPSSPALLPLVCDQEWEKGAYMLSCGRWLYDVGESEWLGIGSGHPLSLGRGSG